MDDIGAFLRRLRHNLAWRLPFWWSVRMAWRTRHGPTAEMCNAFADYRRLTAPPDPDTER